MRTRFLPLLAIAALVARISSAQTSTPFDIDAYRSFLNTHASVSSGELQNLYPAHGFASTAGVLSTGISYLDNIRSSYSLTGDEESLLSNHGFVVSGRQLWPNMNAALYDVYQKDLPVFVTTDAILHALHKSYDGLLMAIETGYLVTELDSLLFNLHSRVPDLGAAYGSIPGMGASLRDVDLYLTIPRILLGQQAFPVFPENAAPVAELLARIESLAPSAYPLFSSELRIIDFSQFTPRGHYTDHGILQAYFQAMIWLGRTEIYLVPPNSAGGAPPPEDVVRQIIDAALLDEAAVKSGVKPRLETMDFLLQKFVGVSDNVTLDNIHDVLTEAAVPNAAALLDSAYSSAFVNTLIGKSYVFQRINSQILMSDPMSPDQIRPASAFLLLGQRFVIDSYVTGNVVYDRIVADGLKVRRMLPSTLDILFALGNDGAAQLLATELDVYKYGQNLAGLRYLVDSYEPAFWGSSLYNGWLNAIRALNPPGDRSTLPPFMQTAAWWQEKMTTQLASWAELRHDNLLYAKQSYSGGITCSYPSSYVEPIPSFYRAMGMLADSVAAAFTAPPLGSINACSWVAEYFSMMSPIMDTLEIIAEKELAGVSFSSAEQSFLAGMLTATQGGACGNPTIFNGWYTRLFPVGTFKVDGSADMVVADVHTAPTDEYGDAVGWVLHGGTGPVNLALVVAALPGGVPTAFVGPVSSYYEVTTTNFKRLTDQEWETAYAIAPSGRPSLTHLYASTVSGSSAGPGPSLITGVTVPDASSMHPEEFTLGQNYPNPFNPTTTIAYTIVSSQYTTLKVYDILGREVSVLADGISPPGRYMVRFDGSAFASGMYIYRLESGGRSVVRSMMMVK